MAGNSQRRGAVRKPAPRRGRRSGPVASGAAGSRGKGATRRPMSGPTIRLASGRPRRPGRRQGRQKKTDDTEIVLGRNPVVECLRANVPATALYVALGTESDERLTESSRGQPIPASRSSKCPRTDLDRMSSNGLHRGIAPAGAAVPVRASHRSAAGGHLRCDARPAGRARQHLPIPGTWARSVRSAAAFGGHGVLIPQRRSASVTAVAWRHQCRCGGPVAGGRATNLNRTLKDWGDAGLQIVGWMRVATPPGRARCDRAHRGGGRFGGKGLSRLVRENCDAVVSIPMAG